MKFTPANTLRPRWYLIAVDMESTSLACPNYLSDFTYWCVFQARHPADKSKSDEYARWWPEWHRYSRDSVTNNIVYGDRILFPPNRVPCSSKYIEWTEPLTLSGQKTVSLVGPFNFSPISQFNRVRRTIDKPLWKSLHDACLTNGITPPTLGASNSHIPSNPRQLRKRKANVSTTCKKSFSRRGQV